MWHNFKLIPNQITLVRFLMVPAIWGMVIAGIYDYIGISLIVCFVSDVLDGQLARRLHQTTNFGAKFDSLADNILIPSALIWLLMLKTEIFSNHLIILLPAITTYIASLIISHVYTRRTNVSQLYLSKLSGLTQYIFGIHTFVAGQYNVELFYLTMGIFFISSLESLLLQFIKVEVKEQLTSLLLKLPVFRHVKIRVSYFNLIPRIIGGFYGARPTAPKDNYARTGLT
jgi:cardiolipin synthase (CMP-forming)